MGTLDLPFSPDERSRVLIVGRHKILKGCNQVLPAWEARSRQGLPAQDAEPDLDLVEPGRGGRRKVKGHIGMTAQPVLVFLMGRQIVQNHMDFLFRRIILHDLFHEVLEVFPLLGLGRLASNDARGDCKRCKEIDGPMTLVGAFHATNHFSALGFDIFGRALDRLDRRLLVHRQDHGMSRRIQIQSDNIGGLPRKLRIGADTPRPATGQLDAFLSENPPDDIIRHVQDLGQRSSVPSRQALRRRLFQLREDPAFKLRSVGCRFSGTCLIPETLDPFFGKPLSPYTDGVGPNRQFMSHFIVSHSVEAQENDLRPFHKPGLFASTSGQLDQGAFFFGRTGQSLSNSGHSDASLVGQYIPRNIVYNIAKKCN